MSSPGPHLTHQAYLDGPNTPAVENFVDGAQFTLGQDTQAPPINGEYSLYTGVNVADALQAYFDDPSAQLAQLPRLYLPELPDYVQNANDDQVRKLSQPIVGAYSPGGRFYLSLDPTSLAPAFAETEALFILYRRAGNLPTELTHWNEQGRWEVMVEADSGLIRVSPSFCVHLGAGPNAAWIAHGYEVVPLNEMFGQPLRQQRHPSGGGPNGDGLRDTHFERRGEIEEPRDRAPDSTADPNGGSNQNPAANGFHSHSASEQRSPDSATDSNGASNWNPVTNGFHSHYVSEHSSPQSATDPNADSNLSTAANGFDPHPVSEQPENATNGTDTGPEPGEAGHYLTTEIGQHQIGSGRVHGDNRSTEAGFPAEFDRTSQLSIHNHLSVPESISSATLPFPQSEQVEYHTCETQLSPNQENDDESPSYWDDDSLYRFNFHFDHDDQMEAALRTGLAVHSST